MLFFFCVFLCAQDSYCERGTGFLQWKYVYLNDHHGSVPMHVHCRDGALFLKVLQKLGLSEKGMLED